MRSSNEEVDAGIRIGVVLSAGGLRGAAHAGVLRQLVRHGIPLHTIVGVSAGAIVAAYYAAVGLELDEMIADAGSLRGQHLLAHSLSVHCNPRFGRRLHRWCGVIPGRLQQLEEANFARLHHGITRLGIVCHDLSGHRPLYFGTGFDQNVTLDEAVRASASIPHLFPAVSVARGGVVLRLVDGGISDPVPLAFARRPAMGATHIIVSDCRRLEKFRGTPDARTVWIRPLIRATSTLRSPREGLLATVREGEIAVTDEILSVIAGWLAS